MDGGPGQASSPIRRLLGALVLAGALGGAGLAAAVPASAQDRGGTLAADEALRLARAGELILVDVRSPQEWRRTGLPAGARPVTIHNAGGLAGFLEEMRRELAGELDRPIAVICARGNRSTLARSALARAGYTRVLNVREGMFGSVDGPGWLARGLPVDPCERC